MNRIEEIKDTVRTIKKTAMSVSDLSNEEYLKDMEYLLSKLEIAEKALEDLSRFQLGPWREYEVNDKAEKALKSIRE